MAVAVFLLSGLVSQYNHPQDLLKELQRQYVLPGGLVEALGEGSLDQVEQEYIDQYSQAISEGDGVAVLASLNSILSRGSMTEELRSYLQLEKAVWELGVEQYGEAIETMSSLRSMLPNEGMEQCLLDLAELKTLSSAYELMDVPFQSVLTKYEEAFITHDPFNVYMANAYYDCARLAYNGGTKNQDTTLLNLAQQRLSECEGIIVAIGTDNDELMRKEYASLVALGRNIKTMSAKLDLAVRRAEEGKISRVSTSDYAKGIEIPKPEFSQFRGSSESITPSEAEYSASVKNSEVSNIAVIEQPSDEARESSRRSETHSGHLYLIGAFSCGLLAVVVYRWKFSRAAGK